MNAASDGHCLTDLKAPWAAQDCNACCGSIQPHSGGLPATVAEAQAQELALPLLLPTGVLCSNAMHS